MFSPSPLHPSPTPVDMELKDRVQESLSGTHTIERELGGGGMSRVFVATERRLGRPVVVKVLAPELAAAMSAERFEREIQLSASLQQANIVPIIAAGDLNGLPYYTMPFVDGESLRARLAHGPVQIDTAIDILRDVAKALAYAHDRGVVHRDIKPDNILLAGRSAVVADFGIAKAIAAAQERPVGATLTQLGTAVGTPAYMAPEQAAGDPSTDNRADLYAFGCVAYELLAGHPPFHGLTPHKLMAAQMGETPRPVEQLRPDCPPTLARLIARCLAKDPEKRPANAEELLQELAVTTTAPGVAMPFHGRGLFLRAMAFYAAAFIGVAIVARLLVDTQGLPEWVFGGALVVMALGFPVILFTGYTQYVARKVAQATPTLTPHGTLVRPSANGTIAQLAVKASPHMSWTRTLRGGVRPAREHARHRRPPARASGLAASPGIRSSRAAARARALRRRGGVSRHPRPSEGDRGVRARDRDRLVGRRGAELALDPFPPVEKRRPGRAARPADARRQSGGRHHLRQPRVRAGQ